MEPTIRTYDAVTIAKGRVLTIDTRGYDSALIHLDLMAGSAVTTLGATDLEVRYGVTGGLHRSFTAPVYLAGALPLISVPIDCPGGSLELFAAAAVDCRVAATVYLKPSRAA